MVHIMNLKDLHIDCDRKLKKFMDSYPELEKSLNKFKHILDNLLEDFFLDKFTIMNINKRVNNLIDSLSEFINLIDIFILVEDILIIIEENIEHYVNEEEYEIANNMTLFRRLYLEENY